MDTVVRKLLQLLQDPAVEIDALGFSVALVISAVAAVIVSALYQVFYEDRATGAQIHRSFLLLSPAITAIFIGVQFSLPLSLGLLGALSIIRFRTPIKEPEEVGFVMVLIATAIVCATFQFLLLLVLLVVVAVSLVFQRYVPFVTRSRRQDGIVVITMNGKSRPEAQGRVLDAVSRHLVGGKLQRVTQSEDGMVVQYAFVGFRDGGLQALHETLTEIEPAVRVNTFFNRQGALQ